MTIPEHALVHHQTHAKSKPAVIPKPVPKVVPHPTVHKAPVAPVEHHKVVAHKNETHHVVKQDPHVVKVNKTHAIVVPPHAIPINKTHAVVFEHAKTHKTIKNLTQVDPTNRVARIVPIEKITASNSTVNVPKPVAKPVHEVLKVKETPKVAAVVKNVTHKAPEHHAPEVKPTLKATVVKNISHKAPVNHTIEVKAVPKVTKVGDNWCKKNADCIPKIGPSCKSDETPMCHLDECYCDKKHVDKAPKP